VWCQGAFNELCPFYHVLWCTFFFYYQDDQHVEGVTIIKSSSGTKQGDSLKGHLFALAYYWILLKTIAWAPNCVFPSLANNTHIVGPMNELSYTFDHLSNQLAQVGLKVEVSKCKCCSPLGICLIIEIPHNCILVTNGLRILGVLVSF